MLKFIDCWEGRAGLFYIGSRAHEKGFTWYAPKTANDIWHVETARGLLAIIAHRTQDSIDVLDQMQDECKRARALGPINSSVCLEDAFKDTASDKDIAAQASKLRLRTPPVGHPMSHRKVAAAAEESPTVKGMAERGVQFCKALVEPTHAADAALTENAYETQKMAVQGISNSTSPPIHNLLINVNFNLVGTS